METETRTILVLDDQPAVRRVVARSLARIGFDPIEASSFQQAEEIVSERHVDLLITDVLMPGITGPRLAESLQQRGLVDRFLFISGHLRGTLDDSGLTESMPFLAKPFTPDELIAQVAAVLEQD
jgi:two-component system cell cycle sensor histidine kinase/response regulator CckA